MVTNSQASLITEGWVQRGRTIRIKDSLFNATTLLWYDGCIQECHLQIRYRGIWRDLTMAPGWTSVLGDITENREQRKEGMVASNKPSTFHFPGSALLPCSLNPPINRVN